MDLLSEGINDSVFNFNTIRNEQKIEKDQEKILAEVMKDIKKEMKLKSQSDNKRTTSHLDTLDKWLEYDKQLKIQRDWVKPENRYHFNHFDTGIQVSERDTRFDNFDFKPHVLTPPSPPARTGAHGFRALGGVVGGLLGLILLANACRKKDKRTRRGVVLVPGAVAGAGTVQQDVQTNRTPSGQGGFPPTLVVCQPSDPPNFDLPPPYSECITQNVSEPTPPFTNPANTEPLVHNGLVEIGFRNDCVAKATASNDSEGIETESVFDNGRIVERLSLDLSKKTGQATGHSDVTDRVVYVDEKSTPTRRLF